jgi:hypothetical protein
MKIELTEEEIIFLQGLCVNAKEAIEQCIIEKPHMPISGMIQEIERIINKLSEKKCEK